MTKSISEVKEKKETEIDFNSYYYKKNQKVTYKNSNEPD